MTSPKQFDCLKTARIFRRALPKRPDFHTDHDIHTNISKTLGSSRADEHLFVMSTNTSSNSSHHGSLDPSDYCKLGTCPLELANFTYVPSLGGNVAYLAIFAALLIPNVYLGIRYKTWGYTVGMVCGLVLEVIGYAGRVQLHFNPFPFDPFLE